MSKDATLPKRITASTMLELKAAIHAHHGWTSADGESTAGRISALYDLSANTHVGLYVATPKSAASAKPVGPVRLRDEGSEIYLDGVECQYSIEQGAPWPNSETIAYVFDPDIAERITDALNAAPVAREPAESVLVDGTAHTVPAAVAAEMLRLQIELKQATSVAQEPVAWPKNAQEIRNFINTNFISRKSGDAPSDDDEYFLTAHDLLSAFDWWADIAPVAARAAKGVDHG